MLIYIYIIYILYNKLIYVANNIRYTGEIIKRHNFGKTKRYDVKYDVDGSVGSNLSAAE